MKLRIFSFLCLVFFIISVLLLSPIHINGEQLQIDHLQQLVIKAESTTSPAREKELADRIEEATYLLEDQSTPQYELDNMAKLLQYEINYADVELVIIDELISINYRGESFDEKATEKMIANLQKAPKPLRDFLINENVEVKLINFPLTEMPEYADLKDVVPRGWEDTGKTWKDVPGLGGNPMIARIGHSDPGTSHGSKNLELHEFGHIIDQYVFSSVSLSEPFTSIHKEEAPRFLNDEYSIDYVEEYFAEVYDAYFYNQETHTALQRDAPKTYEFLDRFLSVVDRGPLLTTIQKAEETDVYNVGINIDGAYSNAITVFQNAMANQEEVDDATKLLENKLHAQVIHTKEIDDLITIRYKGNYDEDAVNKMIQNIYKIPESIRNTLSKKNKKIQLINFPMHELPEMNHVDDVGPTICENMNSLPWEDVPAYGTEPLYINLSETNNHPFLNLELHMFAHLLEDEYLSGIKKDEFTAIHLKERGTFLIEAPFYQHANEYFAESVSHYFYNEESKGKLKKNAPKTYKFIEEIVEPDKSTNQLIDQIKVVLIAVSTICVGIISIIGGVLIRKRRRK